jgi:hypothetical protein
VARPPPGLLGRSGPRALTSFPHPVAEAHPVLPLACHHLANPVAQPFSPPHLCARAAQAQHPALPLAQPRPSAQRSTLRFLLFPPSGPAAPPRPTSAPLAAAAQPSARLSPCPHVASPQQHVAHVSGAAEPCFSSSNRRAPLSLALAFPLPWMIVCVSLPHPA